MDRQTRMYDNFDRVEQRTIEEILNIVYDALEEKRIQCDRSDGRIYFIRRSILHNKP